MQVRDNSPLIEEILALRHELAQLFGFANYAERSLATNGALYPAGCRFPAGFGCPFLSACPAELAELCFC